MSEKQYDNSNSGVLFVNDRKEKATHPDLRGEGNIVTADGVEVPVWISAWTKTSKSGKKLLSLSFTLKDGAKSAAKGGGSILDDIAQPAAKESGAVPGLDDSIPF